LARKLNARLAAVVAGADAGAHAKALAAHGADKVYVAADDGLARYTTAAYTSLLADAITAYKPIVVLLPSTSNGRDLAPRVAARLGAGLTADCVYLDVNESGSLIQYKPAFGGNIVALIYSRTLPQIATVKPGMLQPVRPNERRTAEVIRLAVPPFDDQRVRLIAARKEVSLEIAELDEAERIICVGTGIGGPESLTAIDTLAKAMNAHVGGTRRVVDQGWLPRHQQIGLTGRLFAMFYLGIECERAQSHHRHTTSGYDRGDQQRS
jgi:electron transfer flavoprotein alpha subunit